MGEVVFKEIGFKITITYFPSWWVVAPKSFWLFIVTHKNATCFWINVLFHNKHGQIPCIKKKLDCLGWVSFPIIFPLVCVYHLPFWVSILWDNLQCYNRKYNWTWLSFKNLVTFFDNFDYFILKLHFVVWLLS